MRFLNVLAAVHPRLRDIVWRTLGQNADVSFVDTLDHAIRDLELRDYSLILSSTQFDDSRMLDLLQHCARSPAISQTSFVCMGATAAGCLLERSDVDVQMAVHSIGAKYIDLRHWIETDDCENAAAKFRGVISSLLCSTKHGERCLGWLPRTQGAMVAESDVQATAPGDKADASKSDNVKFPRYAAGQECSNCSLYQGKAGDAAGSCQLLSGKQA
jgi:hypothetical protein